MYLVKIVFLLLQWNLNTCFRVKFEGVGWNEKRSVAPVKQWLVKMSQYSHVEVLCSISGRAKFIWNIPSQRRDQLRW